MTNLTLLNAGNYVMASVCLPHNATVIYKQRRENTKTHTFSRILTMNTRTDTATCGTSCRSYPEWVSSAWGAG